MSETRQRGIDALLSTIRTWIETESGPTKLSFSNPELALRVKIRGYKKIILERDFELKKTEVSHDL